MQTEVRKSLDSGFLLTEAELTRIQDVMSEQTKKVSGGQNPIIVLEIKYKNGAISSPATLNEIFIEENDGRAAITRTKIEVKNPVGSGLISISFNNKSDPLNSDLSSISYTIGSDDKDWAFITSSMLEERIQKVKSNAIINYIMGGEFFSFTLLIISAAFAIFALLPMTNASSRRLDNLRIIHQSSKSLSEYVYRRDVMEATIMAPSFLMPYLTILLVSLPIFGLLFRRSVAKWVPRYVFYWGDYVKKYDRLAGMIKFFMVAIVLAVVVGVLTNYISIKMF